MTSRDQLVLNAIFHPNEPNVLHTEWENEDQQPNNDNDYSIPELQQLNQLEVEAIQLTEQGEFEAALTKLNEAIKLVPNSPAAYNNRAQVYRLMQRNREAMCDLDKAVDICREEPPVNTSVRIHQHALCMALIQRGMLRRFMASTSSPPATEGGTIPSARTSDDSVEVADKLAQMDFEEACKLPGGNIAKQLLVQMNPYAALCNQMLRDMIRKCQSGESSSI